MNLPWGQEIATCNECNESKLCGSHYDKVGNLSTISNASGLSSNDEQRYRNLEGFSTAAENVVERMDEAPRIVTYSSDLLLNN